MIKENMVLPIELTQIIRKSNECLKHRKIKIDASTIIGMWDYGNCTSVVMNVGDNREEIEVEEKVEQICIIIGGEFYACDKNELAQKILSKKGDK